MKLQKFAVTVRVFGADDGRVIADYLLPVDSPDAEHAASSTMANAISFTPKIENGAAKPIAFRCLKVESRQ